MAGASYLIPSFLGGEISKFAQGRYDKPDYRISMQVCLNSFPLEAGPWTRRPGTMHAGTTLGGAPGRVIKFDFEQAQPYTLEFTDGKMRFRSGPTLVSGTLTTPYVSGTWADVRAVQAETTDILLHPTIAPQALTVTTPPVGTTPAAFALSAATFNDGPYLDPFTNGAQAVPNALSGIITIALQFPAYVATKAYAQGAFVTSAGICYISLADQNVGNTPVSTPAFWQATGAGAAINNGQGFLGSDIGRLVRMFSEPLAWDVATAYAASTAAAPVVVAYNPSGLPGATVYYTALVASTAKVPGTDLVNWQIVPQGAAIWTWGKITGLTNAVNPALPGGVNFGSMIGGGGLGAAFNGNFSQTASNSAEKSGTGGAAAAGTIFTLDTYVGKDYSGASNQIIEHATVYPSSDQGLAAGTYTITPGLGTPYSQPFVPTITLNLRGGSTAPVSPSDGALLGSVTITNLTAPITVNSTDITTAWKYVWIQEVAQFQIGGALASSASFFFSAIAQVSFFNPSGSGVSGNGVKIEILGPPLLRSGTPIATWRLGAFSNTTGWPSCGVYYEGRLWLGGAIANRFDASVSNGIDRGTINFAPTDQYGVVAANAAISYTLNSDSVNPMYWMKGDLQGIKIGTQAGEWLVQAPTNGPITPTNIAARQVSHIGSANIEPRQTEHTLAFVKRAARKLIEYFSDANFNKLSGPNLAEKAEHIITSGIAEIAYTDAVNPVIWGRCNDGSLFGVTYKRDTLTTAAPPTFAGWHRHTLGTGRTVESICSGPSVGGNLDALTMVTNDPATNIRHVEILTDTPNENTTLANSWFLDDAIRPGSRPQSDPSPALPYGGITLNGLSHLEGKTVQVFAAGLDLGDRGEGLPISDFVVTGGSVFIPFGDGVSSGPGRGLFTRDFANSFGGQMLVGCTYSSRGQPVRPVAQADTGARNGPGFGKLSREHRYAIKVVNARGMSVGTSFDSMLPVNFLAGDFPIPVLSTFTGIHADALEDIDDYERTLCWEITRPFPATVTAVGPNLDTKDQ